MLNPGLLLTNFISALLLPPLNLLLVAATALLLHRRYPRSAPLLAGAALAALALLCTEAGAWVFVSAVENQVAPLADPRHSNAQAIVVLSGGRLTDAPEYGDEDVPNSATLLRLRYAAHLQRETRLPLLTTGGMPTGGARSQAATMAKSLTKDFGVPVRWLEEASDNTAENASKSAAILLPQGVRRILLVTDAMHMPRSIAIFERNGFEVVPAPTVFLSRDRITPLSFLPGGEGLRRTHYAWHEAIGMLWYRIRHGAGGAFGLPEHEASENIHNFRG